MAGGSGPATRGAKWSRRIKTIPGLVAFAVAITIAFPIWLPATLIIDCVRLRWRMPLARLLTFGVMWAWIEVTGVIRAFGTWIAGRAGDPAAQYALMKWWAESLMRALERTGGIRPVLEGAEALEGGNAIVLSRHASLADSLLSGWAIRVKADLWPRYVLKRELLFDPCLDIVGLRLPNHFLDREAVDTEAELSELTNLAHSVGPGSVAVIFAEGTRANPDKRQRALAKIAERDPERAQRLSGLRRLLPPRPSGSSALLDGAPDADVVLAWHTGFDGLDSFGGIIDKLSEPLPPVRFVTRRVARGEVASGEAFTAWLDGQWLAMDELVDAALAEGRR